VTVRQTCEAPEENFDVTSVYTWTGREVVRRQVP
jgi:hypothetical protein